MSMKRLLAVSLLLLPGLMFAQSPFDGTWKTNMSASKLSQKPYTYSVSQGMYVCETCAPRVSAKADGSDQAVTGQPYDTIAVTVVDPNTIHLVTKNGGKMVSDQTRTVSADGKMMTISVTAYPANGSDPYKTEVHLARVSAPPAGSNATGGTWRLQKMNEDSPGITTAWKATSDGLSMSAPTGEHWDAKFDGKEVPVNGTYQQETVSVKKLGDREVEITEKRDGKLYSVAKMTVSPDGTKMTTVYDNKQTGRVSTYIDEKQ
jgi:hypothetical protein